MRVFLSKSERRFKVTLDRAAHWELTFQKFFAIKKAQEPKLLERFRMALLRIATQMMQATTVALQLILNLQSTREETELEISDIFYSSNLKMSSIQVWEKRVECILPRVPKR